MMILPMLLEVSSQLRLVVGKITQQGIAASGVAEHALAHDRLIPEGIWGVISCVRGDR
jgi:hypothetical protein